jgi:uncharacterized protein YbaR (Trm112 family)/SAM-dependent methyltransferase
MHTELLDILRCPYCGTTLDLVRSSFHETEGEDVRNGILGCQCCVFPVVDGIPVMHLSPAAVAAREHIDAGRPDLALRSMNGLDDEQHARRFEETAASSTATYSDLVAALGPGFEGGYFLYRFSDPTFVVADAMVRAVAGAALRSGGRALDVCGGSGHVTRALVHLSSPAPVLADLFFPKIWLARRFTAPGAIPVCCDGNAPLPFARGAFDFALCSDAFMFIWHKRQFVGELFRAVDASARATVLINHTHNQLVWSPSHGNPLLPSGYRNLFETRPARAFGESKLFADVVDHRHLDLTREHSDEDLATEAALTFIASTVDAVFAKHEVREPSLPDSEWRINPLYAVQEAGGRLQGVLRFPSPDYADEYGECRRYLPDSVDVDQVALRRLQEEGTTGPLDDLIRRRVILQVPRSYF